MKTYGETASVLFYSNITPVEIDTSISHWTAKWSSFVKCTCSASTCVLMSRIQRVLYGDLILNVARLRTELPPMNTNPRGHLMIFPEISDLDICAQNVAELINTKFYYPGFVLGSFVAEFKVVGQTLNHIVTSPTRLTRAIIGSMSLLEPI